MRTSKKTEASNGMRTFCIKHYGENGVGSGTSLVVASSDFMAREMLWQHFLQKQSKGVRMQVHSKSTMEVELLEDSCMCGYRVSTATAGVIIEFQYPDIDAPRELEVVFIDCGADALADKLDKLQAVENQGRGVSCVRTIVHSLRRGDLTAAFACTNNEGDKIRSYDAIYDALKAVGFVQEWILDFD